MTAPKKIPPPSKSYIRGIVQTALDEDLGVGDVTTNTLLSPHMTAKANIVAQEPMVVSGLAVAHEVFHQIDPLLQLRFHCHDGAWVKKNASILSITGNAIALLQAERVALNFMQRLSGISTLTHQYCRTIAKHPIKIADTRKTTPGLRALEKWAVRLGGGFNHRSSLHDGILIKDNHLTVLAANHLTLGQACRLAKHHAPHGLRISVEVETLSQVRDALQGKADIILLDNMTPLKVREAVKIIKNKALVEISGGITLSNILDMAKTGADIISIGALTHSAPAMDISMDFTAPKPKGKK